MNFKSLPWPAPKNYDSSKDRQALANLAKAVESARLKFSNSQHAEQIVVIDPEFSSADPPAVLKDLADETAGVAVGEFYFSLLSAERSSLGPFTLLGEFTEYYPLFESGEEAVILTLNEAGYPGGVWWIDEELNLNLIAISLSEYLDLITAAINQLDENEEASFGEQIWRQVLAKQRARVEVLDSVTDYDARIKFSNDGLSAQII